MKEKTEKMTIQEAIEYLEGKAILLGHAIWAHEVKNPEAARLEVYAARVAAATLREWSAYVEGSSEPKEEAKTSTLSPEEVYEKLLRS